MSKWLVSSEVLQLHNFFLRCCSSTFCCSIYKCVTATFITGDYEMMPVCVCVHACVS